MSAEKRPPPGCAAIEVVNPADDLRLPVNYGRRFEERLL